jgi:hypothetical protein
MTSSLDRQEPNRHSTTALRRQELRMLLILRMAFAGSSLAFFAVIVLTLVAVVFLVGFGKMVLPEKLTLALITVMAAPAAVFNAIMRYLFPK